MLDQFNEKFVEIAGGLANSAGSDWTQIIVEIRFMGSSFASKARLIKDDGTVDETFKMATMQLLAFKSVQKELMNEGLTPLSALTFTVNADRTHTIDAEFVDAEEPKSDEEQFKKIVGDDALAPE